MNKRDVAPPGRESQVKALKSAPNADNPFAVAWASYNKDAKHEEADDAGSADFESVVGSLTAEGSPDVPRPPGVDEPRSTGHSGTAYTYGQRRGNSPAPSHALEVARDREPHAELADDDDMFDDAGETIEGAASGEHLAGSDATRGHPKYGAGGVSDPHVTGDDGGEFDEFAGEGGAHEQVEHAAHAGAGGHAVGDDDDDLYDDDAEGKGDAGASAPQSGPEAAQIDKHKAEEEAEEAEDLDVAPQPAPTDEPVRAKPAGTSSGPIRDVPVTGQG